MFPVDFEEAYNRLHGGSTRYYGGDSGIVSSNVMPLEEHKHRRAVQIEEKTRALKQSIANPRSRLYPSVTQRGVLPQPREPEVKARGGEGELKSEEARKLVPILLKKRADDYRRLNAQEVEPSADKSPISASQEIADKLEGLLNSVLTTISVGNFSKDILELSNNVLNVLLSSGNLLTTRQLEYLYSYIPTILEYAGRRIRIATRAGEVGRPQDIPAEDKRNASYVNVLLNVVGRVFRAILSKSEAPTKSRALFQKSVRVEASKFLKKKVDNVAPPRRLNIGRDEEIRRYGFEFPRFVDEE
jgi:hypothetical protein